LYYRSSQNKIKYKLYKLLCSHTQLIRAANKIIMIKNYSKKIKYLISATILILSFCSRADAQNLSISHLTDSSCYLYISLVDSNNNIVSNNPPYLFSVGNNNINSNSAALTNYDMSNMLNGVYTITVVDGSQSTYSSTVSINCGQTPGVPSNTFLNDSTGNAFNCTSCNGVATISVINPNGLYTFNWSNGYIDTLTTSSFQPNLCPGNYYVNATDSNGLITSHSFSILCNANPTTTSCYQTIEVFLDQNGSVTIYPQDLNSLTIDPDSTIAYIIDESGNFHTDYTFNCNHTGYNNLSLYFYDSLTNLTDTCNLLVQVSDTNGICNGSPQTNYIIQGNGSNASNCNTCDGLFVIGSVTDTNTFQTAPLPYTYLWSNNSVSGPTINGLCPNQLYTVTVTDTNGIQYIETITIGCNGSSAGSCQDSSLIDPNLTCAGVYIPVCGCNGQTYVNSCIAEYQHGISSWTNGICGSTGINITGTVTPANSCDNLNCTGSINLNPSGGVPPYSYNWSSAAITGNAGTGLCAGSYYVTVTDSFNNLSISTMTVGIAGCVWPGDTDDNTIANNFDLLSIGLAFSDTGSIRVDSSITWSGHVAQDWTIPSINGLPNYKYIDCNGDGIINTNDITAIQQNYGSSYYRSSSSLWGPIPFYLQSIISNSGDTVSVPLILGDSINPVNNAYGLAFTINYDPTLIHPGSVTINFDSSWLGNDLIDIQKNFGSSGSLDVAVSRKNKLSITGFGGIGKVDFTIKDDMIMGKVNNPGNNLAAPFSITNIRLIDEQNNEIGTNPQTGLVTIITGTGLNIINNDLNIKLFPNPARELLHIISKEAWVQSIRLYTATGQLVQYIDSPFPENNSINTSELAGGIYFISIQTEKGIYNNRIQVIR
jgi:hypothetical protein